MFGKNPIRGSENAAGDRLAVQEIFYTIQGEGPLSGEPAVFIRLAGCNLACHFCDTEFESGINNLRSIVEIVNEVTAVSLNNSGKPLVVLTGGEPLRQNVVPLIERLVTTGYRVQIETAGTLWLDGLDAWVTRSRHIEAPVTLVCSPKTPKVHPMVAEHCHHWKYIVRADELGLDGLPSVGTQKATADRWQMLARPPKGRDVVIWLSPCDDYDVVKNRANVAAATQSVMLNGYRLSLQVHKLAGLP